MGLSFLIIILATVDNSVGTGYGIAINFGNVIKAQGETKNLSLRRLADILDIDPAYLSRVESDKMSLSAEKVVLAVAAALEATTWYKSN